MNTLNIYNQSRNSSLGGSIQWARWWWQRFRGLLGTEGLPAGGGLLITPCRAIHMHGMKYSLDVLFLDKEGIVLATYPAIAPGERTPLERLARAALELPVGTLERSQTSVGDQISWS